jgi:hypothetical protein
LRLAGGGTNVTHRPKNREEDLKLGGTDIKAQVVRVDLEIKKGAGETLVGHLSSNDRRQAGGLKEAVRKSNGLYAPERFMPQEPRALVLATQSHGQTDGVDQDIIVHGRLGLSTSRTL